MNSEVWIFGLMVAFTLGLSFYLGARARSSKGYFAAGGGIHWFVNGVAFAGDYLSAASFLGICGMIAFFGYDGFLYSIGYLAGWVVALFVVAEPLKRMGKFTFADALDSQFDSRGIKLTAAISTLAVSVFYLIPQMVGAGAIVKPLFGYPHWVGVILVGSVVTVIVVTAGMVSTTYVQFLKGALLVIFSGILTALIVARGLVSRDPGAGPDHLEVLERIDGDYRSREELQTRLSLAGFTLIPASGGWEGKPYLRIVASGSQVTTTWYESKSGDDGFRMQPAQTVATRQGTRWLNGRAETGVRSGELAGRLWSVGTLELHEKDAERSQGPLAFLGALRGAQVTLWNSELIKEPDDSITTVYYPRVVTGSDLLRPGNHPAFKGIRSPSLWDKLNFLSLMLALFGGTAALPHILIRYYTVKDQAAARKSTIVGIGSIGLFYVLTLYIGLGAMSSGALDVTNSNMAAPLLAKSFSPLLFAIISAIAFTTVLGTVSGLIIAAAGAVVHDLMSNFLRIEMHDHAKVRVAKIASVLVGTIAIGLGIVFEKMNVTYLVGWAFSVAASANLPSLIMLLFWKRTTRQGITVAISVGMASSLAWILMSGDTYKDVYGLPAADAWVPFSQPGIVTIPLGFLVLIAVSLLTQHSRHHARPNNAPA
ncbi:MAG: cation acetate symporter [Planctomycetes bacterium]|nr:cation acetate symporter [Planctomycetota bacterium]